MVPDSYSHMYEQGLKGLFSEMEWGIKLVSINWSPFKQCAAQPKYYLLKGQCTYNLHSKFSVPNQHLAGQGASMNYETSKVLSFFLVCTLGILKVTSAVGTLRSCPELGILKFGNKKKSGDSRPPHLESSRFGQSCGRYRSDFHYPNYRVRLRCTYTLGTMFGKFNFNTKILT